MKIFIFLSMTLLSFNLLGECIGPDGVSMTTGTSLIYFKTNYKPNNGECESAIVNCESGGKLLALSIPSFSTRKPISVNPLGYKFLSCLDEKTCEHPFGLEPLTTGISVEAYQSSEGPCVKETRICDGTTGVLSGSFLNSFCKEKNFVINF